MMKPPTIEELAAELADAYKVIEYTVPTVLRALKRGGEVPLDEQQWFWYFIERLESDRIDLLDDLTDWNGSDSPFCEGPMSMMARQDELMLLGKCVDSNHANVA